MSSPIRIGFVDHELDNYHANVFLDLFRNALKSRGCCAACHAQREESGKQWARKNHVPYFNDLSRMDREVDAYVILAPGNPETHLTLCREVFPFGKPTYVDKMFGPDLATSQEVLALADEHAVPVQTGSALRYTNIQGLVKSDGDAILHMIAWGGGRSFEEYAIHPVELIVSCMGPDVRRLMRRGTGQFSQVLVDFADARTAVANLYIDHEIPYAASITTARSTRYIPVETDTIFLNTAEAVLQFFQTGRPNVDRLESLAVRRVLDAARDPAAVERFVAV